MKIPDMKILQIVKKKKKFKELEELLGTYVARDPLHMQLINSRPIPIRY